MPIHKKFDEEFFRKWNSDMAYILGFLFADGNIIKTKRNTHFVSFHTMDNDLLSSMKKSMKSDHKISARTSHAGCVYRLQIGSKSLFDDLVAKGLTPNKSRRMRFPDIPNEYFGDFIRGYFDGDGNVWVGFVHKKRPIPTQVISAAFTCASQAFLQSMHEALKRKGIQGGSLYGITSKKCSRLLFSTQDTLKLFNIMYTMSHKLFLQRKKLVFERFIRARSSAG